MGRNEIAHHSLRYLPGTIGRTEVDRGVRLASRRVLSSRVDITHRLEGGTLMAIERLVAKEISGVASVPRTTFSVPPHSSRADRVLAIGERVLANRERKVRDARDQGRLL